MLPEIAEMATAMADAGDRSGLKIYGDWIRTKVSPSKIGATEEVLAPLWKFQDDPVMVGTAEQMFNGPPSDWNPMPSHVITGWGLEDLLRSPLLGLQSFRDAVMRGLTDTTDYATATIRADHVVEIKTEGSTDGEPIPSGETRIAPVGSVMKLRTCDKYASQISQTAGAPEFEFYWPLVDRDAAVKACGVFIVTYADRLRYTDRYQFDDDFPMQVACHLTFPQPEHPATVREAETHNAIFSFENQGEHRQVKLLDIPVKAQWVALKKYPFDQQSYDGVKKQSVTKHYFHQDCYVWQAEEVKVNGQWQRYYGVVGPHEIKKVPASEIEFPKESWEWHALSAGSDCKVQPLGWTLDGTKLELFAGKSPLIVHLSFRNRLGLPQDVPTQFVSQTVDGKLAIRPGMNVIIKRLSDDPDPGTEGPDAGTLMERKPMAELPSTLMAQHRQLETNDSFEAATFDLRDCFDLTHAGRYRLQITLSKQSGIGEGTSEPMEIDLK